MNSVPQVQIPEWTPDLVWEELAENPTSILVDVRTKPEWSFVGVPDLSGIGKAAILAEWRSYPRMQRNQDFCEEVESRLKSTRPDTAFFICRSGARSREAAAAYSEWSHGNGKPVRCINVAEGFEGDLDMSARRATKNGWKFRRLSWKQS